MGTCSCANPRLGGCAACNSSINPYLPSPYTITPTPTWMMPTPQPSISEKLRRESLRVAMEMFWLAEQILYDAEMVADLRALARRLQE